MVNVMVKAVKVRGIVIIIIQPLYIYYIHMIEELRNGSSGDETSSYHSYHGNVVVIFIQLYGVFLIYSGGFGACYTHTHIYIYI